MSQDVSTMHYKMFDINPLIQITVGLHINVHATADSVTCHVTQFAPITFAHFTEVLI